MEAHKNAGIFRTW